MTVWVLTTPRLQRLPATIRSRTQRVRFAPLPEAAIATFLEQRAKVPRAAARLLAAVSGGSLARALAMRGEDPKIMRDQALALLEPALRQDAFGLWKAVQNYTKYGRAGREALRTLIEFHELWLRDLLRARYGGAEAALVHADRETEIRRQAERVDGREVRRRLMVLEEVLRSIEGNVAPDLALFSGLARVAGQRLGEDGWPAHLVDRWDY
jgi:DNA polymerase-3 subunit delta'